MPKLVADLHIHSHYSRATSRDLTFEHLHKWAQLKGVHIVGTGDIAHPGWLAEMKQKLEPAEDGLFQLKADYAAATQDDVPPICRTPVRFLLAGEVSNIYKKAGAVRKVHHLIFLPSLAAVERLQAALEKIGNIRSDGRPILGLDSRDLLEIVLETDPQGYLIPAHIWTPWFAVLGSKSGFDSIEACFDDLTPHIFALETGLSSDPPMNWRISALDRYTLVSNSDAHSPQKLAREATVFYTEPSYRALFAALQGRAPATFGGTIEFFPEEGKYHVDGHRNCGIRWEPEMTAAHNGICPVCGKAVTVGVMHRIAALADRPAGARPPRPHAYANLIPLPEILGEVYGVGAAARQVQLGYASLLAKLGAELTILQDLPLDEIARGGGALLAEGIGRMRRGEVSIDAGYDGEYGVIKLFANYERQVATNQIALFGEQPQPAKARKPGRPREEQAAAARPSVLDEQAEVVAKEVAAPTDAAPSTPIAPPPTVEQLLAGLNGEQRAAVLTVEAPLLIVAGPGAGKTRTLTYRMAYLLATAQATPASLLAITFTNQAAEEMVERLTALVGAVTAAALTVKTFHAFAASLLRTAGAALGIDPHFTIIHEEERPAVLRRCDPSWSARTVNELLARISMAKNSLQTPDDLAAAEPDLAAAYRAYADQLANQQLLDFDDLLLLAVRLLESQPAVLQALHTRLRWIAVDEYQDVNQAQHRLLQLLAAGGANVCAIGDPDQAIYGFRGAESRFFRAFPQDFPGAKILRLTQNYRSSQVILDAAAQVIAHNADETRLRIWSEFVDQTRLEIHTAPTDKAEAEYVVHTIERLVGGVSLFSLDSGRVGSSESASRSFADFAVLYRLSAQSVALTEAFARSGIPFQTVGETPLTEHREIGELVAYLALAHNPQAEFYRQQLLADAPKRSVERISGFIDQSRLDADLLVARRIEQIQQFLVENLAHAYDERQQERVAQLVRRATLFGNRLGDFLESLALQRETDLYDPRADRVTLMSLHAAKGLEFPVVFIVGCEETLLPYDLHNRTAEVAEERRLFYVGMTRAQRNLVLTNARRRLLYGQLLHNPPSRFLDEIATALKELKTSEERKPAKEQPAMAQMSLFL